MKRVLLLMVSVCFGLFVKAQDPGFTVEGIGSVPVPVTLHKMTNLVFPQPVLMGVKVSAAVQAQKVRGVDNVIELKALEHFPPTNFSVYGKDGCLYSFLLHYAEDSSVLNFRIRPGGTDHPVMLKGLPVDWEKMGELNRHLAGSRGFLHVRTRRERMVLGLKGVYMADSLQWWVLSLVNHSLIGFRPAFVRFSLVERKKVKRMAVQEDGFEPVFSGAPALVQGSACFSLAFHPFTIPKSKRLMIQVSEQEGGRTLLLPVKYSTILKARTLP